MAFPSNGSDGYGWGSWGVTTAWAETCRLDFVLAAPDPGEYLSSGFRPREHSQSLAPRLEITYTTSGTAETAPELPSA